MFHPPIPGLRIPTKYILGLLVVVLALGFGCRLLAVKSTGRPVGPSVRTQSYIATLIEIQEPYLPSLHRQPANDRFRYELLLQPLTAGLPDRRIPFFRNLAPGGFRNRMGVLGVEAEVIWLMVKELAGFDLKANKVISVTGLRNANPQLGDLLETGHIEFDGRLRISARDQRQVVEFDPVTLQARPATPPKRTGWTDDKTKPEAFLTAGGMITPTDWFGLHSPVELKNEFRPGSRLPRDYPASPSRELRRFYRGQIQSIPDRQEITSITPLTTNEYAGAALIRSSHGGDLLRLSGPEGLLMIYKTEASLGGTLAAARVDFNGRIVWSANTGLADLDQILPDPKSPVVVGRGPVVPGKLSEPFMLIFDSESGTFITRSLWLRNP